MDTGETELNILREITE